MAPLSRAIVLRHGAFRENTVQATIPAAGVVQLFGADPQRWAIIVMVTTGGVAYVRWGGPNRQTIGIGFAGTNSIRLDAVDYPSIVAQEIWVAGAAATVVEATEIVAVG